MWPLAAGIAAVPTVLTLVVVGYNTYRHLSIWHKPRLQRPIVRICVVVPLYAVSSWFSLQFPDAGPYIKTVRDCYEAFVVWCFLTLVLEYSGGESSCVQKIEQQQPLKQPWPCCCFPRLNLNARFLRWCKQGVIQFVVVKPVMAAISLALLGTGHYASTAWTAVSLVVYNTSYSIALYALLLFYLSTKSFLSSFHPVWKFFAFKCVIFVPYWQSLAIMVAPGVPRDQVQQWNDFILCCEMLVLSFVHLCAFPFSEFSHGRTTQTSSVLSNVQEVLSVSDLVREIHHNFNSNYAPYLLQSGGDGHHTVDTAPLSLDGKAVDTGAGGARPSVGSDDAGVELVATAGHGTGGAADGDAACDGSGVAPTAVHVEPLSTYRDVSDSEGSVEEDGTSRPPRQPVAVAALDTAVTVASAASPLSSPLVSPPLVRRSRGSS